MRYSVTFRSSGAAVLMLIALLSASFAVAQRRSPPVLVRSVVDGDTIDIASVGRIQLLGIDAPEPGGRGKTSSPAARAAWERLSGLLTSRWVRLEYESDRPSSGSSAYVYLDDGRFVNAWMVREGLARVQRRAGLRRRAELEAAEREAQAAQRGLWRVPAPP
jgi:endonuclease YncB( thermonuclease family)